MNRSYKRFIGYSTAFRQWRADSHCNKIHGYAFCFKVWFEGELDENGWVIDFGCFKRNGVKEWLKNMFDHTTCIAADDPELELFQEMDNRGIIDLRVLPNGVGCEKFAEHAFHEADKIVREKTDNRCYCVSVEVREHGANSAIFKRDLN